MKVRNFMQSDYSSIILRFYELLATKLKLEGVGGKYYYELIHSIKNYISLLKNIDSIKVW